MSRSFFVWMVVLACCTCKVAHSQTPGTCTLITTGSESLSVPCHVSAAYEAAGNQTGIVITGQTNAVTVTCGIKIPGQVTAKATYSNNSPGVTGACAVQTVTPNGGGWTATRSASSPDRGTFLTTLTSMGVGYTSPGGSIYLAPTGSINATLPAVPYTPATGTVTLTASFQGPAKFAAPPPGAGKSQVLHAPVTNQPVTKP